MSRSVFLSYAKRDARKARRLYAELTDDSDLDVWFDETCLKPGLRWRPAIRRAIRESRYFVALFSKRSVEAPGYVHSELKQALEIFDEFPEDDVYLIPARLDDCRFPHSEIDEIQRVDLFPDWDRGVAEIRELFSGGVAQRSGEGPAGATRSVLDYEYRVLVADLDKQFGNLGELLHELNGRQRFFRFVSIDLRLPAKAMRKVEGDRNLDLMLIGPRFLESLSSTSADLVICLTRELLAFEEDGRLHWNYMGAPIPSDERFIFCSTHELFHHAKDAGIKFEMAVVHIVVSQLVGYFSDWSFHDELRACPMDYTEDHATIAPGLRKSRFCPSCTRALRKNPSLLDAARALLAWGRD